MEELEEELGLAVDCPIDADVRGSQVCLTHESGYAVMQALIAHGVIGDFRAPDMLRFGFAPLYNTPDDISRALDTLETILNERLWDRPEYKVRAAVT